VTVWLSEEREQTVARGNIAGPAFSGSWNRQIEVYERDWHTTGVERATRARHPFIAAAMTCAGTSRHGLCKAMGWKARESDQPNPSSL
jgi:hypothetical protein